MNHLSKSYKTHVLGIDKNFSDFYQDRLFQSCLDKKYLLRTDAILSQQVSREMKAKKGDTITLNNQLLTIVGITDDPWWRGKIAVSSALLKNSGPFKSDAFYLTMDGEHADQYEKYLSKLDRVELAQSFQQEINSLRAFQRFLLGFSIVFFFIAGCNLMLILLARFRREIHLHQTLYFCEETRKIYYLSSIIDDLIICIMSNHMALLLYLLMRPFVPPFFYFVLRPEIYGLEMIIVTIFSIIFTFIFSQKQETDIRTNWRETHAI